MGISIRLRLRPFLFTFCADSETHRHVIFAVDAEYPDPDPIFRGVRRYNGVSNGEYWREWSFRPCRYVRLSINRFRPDIGTEAVRT
jgi:hypothetical protein